MSASSYIIQGDSLKALKGITSDSVHCCVTSPPYYGLRDYEIEGQIGREQTPEQYITRLVAVFHEVQRALRPDGTLWLNISDSYCGTGSKGSGVDPKYPHGRTGQALSLTQKVQGCKQKDLIGIPWLLAFALRNDGWYLRNDIIWHKGNPMPENVHDRCTRSYEHVFLLAKSKRYFYDADAIAEPIASDTASRMKRGRSTIHKNADGIPSQHMQGINRPRAAGSITDDMMPTTRNKRDVWQINTASYKGSHFAVFPPKLAETCILAGCPIGGTVLDPFFGSGTTGHVAKQNKRHYIGIELNPMYCQLAAERIEGA